MFQRLRLSHFALPLTLAAACATTSVAPSRELVAARATYAQAAASTAAAEAPEVLVEARRRLALAERAHEDDPASIRERHLAYMAARHAELAILSGAARQAERDAQAARAELHRTAENAGRAAEVAQAKAERALQQLEVASRQAEHATREIQAANEKAAREQAQRQAAEQAVETSRQELARLEQDLTTTRQQLAERGDQRDAATQALRDREVELQTQVDRLRMERDQQSQQRAQAESERDKALEAIRVHAMVEEDDDRGLVITVPGEVMFRSGSARLLPAARDKLDELATALGNLGTDQQFVIEGYTDSRGSAAYNRRLSQRRANSVRAYLIEQGVEPDRIVARGLGEDAPVASNQSAEGRANNRRVEIVVNPTAISRR